MPEILSASPQRPAPSDSAAPAAAAHLLEGIAAPFTVNNIDTDQIMPKQFLYGIDKTGLARGVLYDLRFDAQGAARPDFVLNRAEYQGARILLAGSNFGCGSSREHAVWGLQQSGIDAVIAPSYGEIFYFNALNNRLLLITLPPSEFEALAAEVAQAADKRLRIDIAKETITNAAGRCYAFAIPARQKHMLLEGLDMVRMTLQQHQAIDAFEQRHWAANPWARIDLPAQQAAAREAGAGTP
jgi:3-isopropylmalate/(R)-2-methylmalate dehydratase small subunit